MIVTDVSSDVITCSAFLSIGLFSGTKLTPIVSRINLNTTANCRRMSMVEKNEN